MARLGVRRAGGMENAVLFGAGRGEGMPDGMRLGARRAGGMAEAACLEVIEGEGKMDGGRFGWAEGWGTRGVAGSGTR